MNLAIFRKAILGILGKDDFSKINGKKTLTEEECAKLREYSFDDRFLSDFKAYLSKGEDEEPDSNKSTVAAITATLSKVTAMHQEVAAELKDLQSASALEKERLEASITAKNTEIDKLQEKIKTLAALPEQDLGKGAGLGGKEKPTFDINHTEQLGGMPGEFNSLDRAYNRRAKAALLARQGKTMEVAAASPVDYRTLQEDLGAFYRTSWTDRIQSYLAELPSIFSIFPTESGHQHLDTLVNLFVGEFSQADSSSKSDFEKVAKGNYEFGHETLLMYDVMFVHIFPSLKDLEKSWIGYLNREGSSPVKLSFIEFLLVETAKALHNEQQLRFINGVRKEPDPNVPGRAMHAADGIFEYLRKRIEGHIDLTPNGGTIGKTVYQIKPFDLPVITAGNIGEVFYQGTAMIPAVHRDSGNVVLYVPSWMMPLYHRYNEAHYGRNKDYEAGILYVKEFPAVKIVPLPNADSHSRIFWTLRGNIQTFDHIPGEMIRFTLEQQDWRIKAWSNWKESIQAMAVGYKYTDKRDMDGSRQLIWCNNEDRPESFFLEQEADKNPSALLHNSLKTAVNSSIFEITDIEDAEVGKVISIQCGAEGDSGVVIKQSGKFELITADWTPSKGNVIKLMKRSDGKFIEISRTTAPSNAYQFTADATVPSLRGATVFVTGDNTAPTEITDFSDAVPGQLYTIHGNGTDNASTITNGGKFSLAEDITLKSGAFIQLTQGADGIFFEIARG